MSDYTLPTGSITRKWDSPRDERVDNVNRVRKVPAVVFEVDEHALELWRVNAVQAATQAFQPG